MVVVGVDRVAPTSAGDTNERDSRALLHSLVTKGSDDDDQCTLLLVNGTRPTRYDLFFERSIILKVFSCTHQTMIFDV